MTITTEVSSGEAGASIFIGDEAVYRILPQSEYIELAKHLSALPANITRRFVETLFQDEKMVHKRIRFISYPHEWCGEMLKEAALFELSLLRDLHQEGYFLKDMHPWNVLFEKGIFKHVDVPSLMMFEAMTVQHHHAFFYDMLMPYFILPLLGLAYGKRAWIRNRIWDTTLQASTSTIRTRDILPAKAWTLPTFKKLGALLLAKRTLTTILKMNHRDMGNKIDKLIHFINSLPVSVGKSDYCHYYLAKNEAQIHYDQGSLNEKQKNVLLVLDNPTIQTVCDVACNTGWYAKLAAFLGKEVIAFDIDEGCIENLYAHVRAEKLNIVPLIASVMQLSPARHAMKDGKIVLISAIERFRSDCVLALGILHHLVLGEGNALEEVIKILCSLAKKWIVLEFIDLQDDKIVDHVDFFPAYCQSPERFYLYRQEYVIEQLHAYCDEVTVKTSSASTRTLLIGRKKSE